MSETPIASPASYAPSTGLIHNLLFLGDKSVVAVTGVVAGSAETSLQAFIYGGLVCGTAILPFWIPPTWTPTSPHKFTAVIFLVCQLLNFAAHVAFSTIDPDALLRSVLIICAINLVRGFLGNQIKYSQAFFIRQLYRGPAQKQTRAAKYAIIAAYIYPLLFNEVLSLIQMSGGWYGIDSGYSRLIVLGRLLLNLYFAADLYFRYPGQAEMSVQAWNESATRDFYSFQNLGLLYPWYLILQYF